MSMRSGVYRVLHVRGRQQLSKGTWCPHHNKKNRSLLPNRGTVRVLVQSIGDLTNIYKLEPHFGHAWGSSSYPCCSVASYWPH